jgi:DNA-binding transcriptional regulator YdaS (Cro superfamily)
MAMQFTTKQAQAMPFLASGMSGNEVAKTIGVQPTTVSQWLNHCPEFSASLERLRDCVTNESMQALQGTVALAVDEVRRILTNGKNETVRLNAAKFVIEQFGLPRIAVNLTGTGSLETSQPMDLAMIMKGLGVSNVL